MLGFRFPKSVDPSNGVPSDTSSDTSGKLLARAAPVEDAVAPEPSAEGQDRGREVVEVELGDPEPPLARIKEEANSLEHLLTHEPKNP